MQKNINSLITVFVSVYSHQIHLAKNKLALYSISSFVFDDNLNSIIGTSFIEGYKLKVKRKDFEKAKTILSLSRI